jgi:hypothetical protein
MRHAPRVSDAVRCLLLSLQAISARPPGKFAHLLAHLGCGTHETYAMGPPEAVLWVTCLLCCMSDSHAPMRSGWLGYVQLASTAVEGCCALRHHVSPCVSASKLPLLPIHARAQAGCSRVAFCCRVAGCWQASWLLARPVVAHFDCSL